MEVQPIHLLWEEGFAKGDPLSPFLFFITIERLKCLIDKVTELELLVGVAISNYDVVISLCYNL